MQHSVTLKQSPNSPPVCAECGAKMTERMVMKGINVGEKYWGCVNFPQCRYTRKKKS